MNEKYLVWSELPEVTTVNQVAAYLQLSANTVKKMLNDRQLRGFKLGSVWRVDKIELLKVKHPKEKEERLADDLRLAAQLLLSHDTELAARLSAHADHLAETVNQK